MPNLAGGSMSWGLYFFGYTMIKDHLKRNQDGKELTAVAHLGSSALAGALTQLVTNPIWVIKTRMCGTSQGDPNALKGLYRKF